MKLFNMFAALLTAAALASCGGGGGSPGNTGSGAGGGGAGGGASTQPTQMSPLRLVFENGAEVTGGRLSQTEPMFLETRLTQAGTGVANTRVTFALDSSNAVLVPTNGAVLTNSSGTARARIAPASVSADGVVGASAAASVGDSRLTQRLDLELSPGVVTLDNLAATPASVQRGQAVNAVVRVRVNGSPAPSNSVGVVFTSNCGEVAPATALVNASGLAEAVIQTNQIGSCQVTATFNAVSLQTGFTVSAPPITSIRFVSATPDRINQAGSPGLTTSIVRFQVVDAVGSGVSSVPVSALLTNTDGGITFCDTPHSAQNSNAEGFVSFSVCSGTLPATVQVRASLDQNTAVFADSNILTVQTGRPTQRFFDISASQLNFWAGAFFTNQFNGNSVDITVFAADRQGNPVPAGTPIVFVSEGGQIVSAAGASRCLIGNNGRCSVQLVGQDYRPLGSNVTGADPRPGRVTVLAYTDGEESFIDANNNNRYDPGELFEDLGLPYIDKDEDQVRTAAYQNLVVGTNEGESTFPLPNGAAGTAACPSNSNVGLSVQNTCNGVWDGDTKVRRSIVVIFSGDEIALPSEYHPSIPLNYRTDTLAAARSFIRVRLADHNGNPLPSNAQLTVQVFGASCQATLVSGNSVGNSTEPTVHDVLLTNCSGGETVLFRAAVAGRESAYAVTVP